MSNSMKTLASVGLLSLIVLFLSSCDGIDPQPQVVSGTTTEIVTTIGSGRFEAKLNGVTVTVSPLSLKVGDEVSIVSTSQGSTDAKITVSSSALGFEKTITPPSTIKKQILKAGTFDIKITYKASGKTAMSSTSIMVI